VATRPSRKNSQARPSTNDAVARPNRSGAACFFGGRGLSVMLCGSRAHRMLWLLQRRHDSNVIAGAAARDRCHLRQRRRCCRCVCDACGSVGKWESAPPPPLPQPCPLWISSFDGGAQSATAPRQHVNQGWRLQHYTSRPCNTSPAVTATTTRQLRRHPPARFKSPTLKHTGQMFGFHARSHVTAHAPPSARLRFTQAFTPSASHTKSSRDCGSKSLPSAFAMRDTF